MPSLIISSAKELQNHKKRQKKKVRIFSAH